MHCNTKFDINLTKMAPKAPDGGVNRCGLILKLFADCYTFWLPFCVCILVSVSWRIIYHPKTVFNLQF